MSDNGVARRVVVASFLGWALDAFDFFLMVFVFSDVAKEFSTSITTVTVAVTLTLAMRPVGALIFGRLADHYGRRPLLMISILCFSILELLSGLAPTLASFLVLRALFGVAMGGEWGIGSSLTMETIPPQWRGWVSGLLQSGYPVGYFLATLAFYVVFPLIGWRGMFFVGVLPALLVQYIRRSVPESPLFGALSQHIGRRITIVMAALLSLPVLPFWAFGNTALTLGIAAFLMQICVQGARGGIPAHLNELSPPRLDGTTGGTPPAHRRSATRAYRPNDLCRDTQDLYPNVFLGVQHGFDHATITTTALIYNAGAVIGGIRAT